MENDMQVASTELSFQPFSGKCVTIIEYPKPLCGMSESMAGFSSSERDWFLHCSYFIFYRIWFLSA